MSSPQLSVIIPARNEERWIEQTIQHSLAACRHFEATAKAGDELSAAGRWEIVVVDNGSTDRTLEILQRCQREFNLTVVRLHEPGAARARNAGRLRSQGQTLVFIDADTIIPVDSLSRIAGHCSGRERAAGITSLGRLDGGVRARMWWSFWNAVRRLPLAHAKAMPAFMFCTAATFDDFGPFDEQVAIGEEWPILAGLYRTSSAAVIYDRSIVARSSSRRMDRGAFGYTRTFLKYVWAILHRQGRIHYTDTIR